MCALFEKEVGMSPLVSSKVAAIIDGSQYFNLLDDAIKQRLKTSARLRAFAPGQVLIREGDATSDLFMIASGQVEVKTTSDDGEVVLGLLGQGQVLGEVHAITGVNRTCTAIAKEMVNAVVIPGALIEEIVDAYPDVKEALKSLVENRAWDTIAKTIP